MCCFIVLYTRVSKVSFLSSSWGTTDDYGVPYAYFHSLKVKEGPIIRQAPWLCGEIQDFTGWRPINLLEI